jgi:NAD(P)H-dependent flavin oxidoreductase YrpB (nitropropane dioxygenase family)
MATLRTPLCDLLAIDVPIIQAAMGGASCPPLAAAVSNAGGLGMLAITWFELDVMRAFLRETRGLTDRPFGVNLALAWPPEERLAMALEEGARIVSLFWGDATPWVERIHRAGALCLHTVGSAAEARRARDAGVDVIVAQGWEAGGHVWGEVATLPLVPAVVDAVAPVPVVAAGGIGDGRGVAAALMLGAQAAWIGTRFLAAEEAFVHPSWRQRIIDAAETDAVWTTLFDKGWDAPHRALRNSTMRRWEDAGRPRSGARPGEDDVVARLPDGTAVPRYSEVPPIAVAEGDLEALVHYAGQSAGLVRRVQPAAEIVRELVEEAEDCLRRAQGFIGR